MIVDSVPCSRGSDDSSFGVPVIPDCATGMYRWELSARVLSLPFSRLSRSIHERYLVPNPALKFCAFLPIRPVMSFSRKRNGLCKPPEIEAVILSQRTELPMVHDGRQEGSAAIELCLLLPVLLSIFAGAVDLSFVYQKYMIVADAAAVGARYGTTPGNSANFSGMSNAAQIAAPGLSGFNATATSLCTCTPGGAAVSCTGTCSASVSPVQYVQVVTGAPATLPFRAWSLPASIQLRSTSTMRIAGAN